MATIEPYFLKSGAKRYRVRYRTPDRRQTDKRGFTSKRAAQDWLAENTVKINAGEWRPAAAGRATVNEVAEAWFEAKTAAVEPKTASAYRGSVNHIARVGTLGNMRIAEVEHQHVEQWIADMKAHRPTGNKALAAKTIRNSHLVLNAVMQRAIRDKRIATNPCTGIDLPRVEHVEQIILTPAEVEAVADAAGPHGHIVRFLAMTGLRWGEMAGLQVRDVDLDAGRIHVQRQITEDNGNLVHGLPKFGRRRIVPVVAPAAAILAEACAGKGATDLVFTTRRGAVLRGGNARRDWFDAAADEAGFPDLTPHHLRHTFASVAIRAGANPKALQQALGHHSATFTFDVYGHLFPDDLDGFTNAMASEFAGTCGQKVGTGGFQASN